GGARRARGGGGGRAGGRRWGVPRGRRAPGVAGGGLPGAPRRRGRLPRRHGGGGRVMTAGPVATQRPGERAGRAGFAPVLRAEWTKFRTVRGWVIGIPATPPLPPLAPI